MFRASITGTEAKKMKKKTEKTALMPLKEAMKMTLRGVKLLYRANPQYTVLSIINTIWSALTPYVGIYLSALIIGELAGGRDPEKLKTYVIISLASAAVIALVSAFINKAISIYGQLEWYSIDKLYRDKFMDMDYADMDSGDTHILYNKIQQNANASGRGLGSVEWRFMDLLSAVATLAGGIAMTVTLFVRRVPESAGGLTVLNSPLFILGIIAVLLLVTYLAPAIKKVVGEFYAKNANRHNLSNQLFGFFYDLAYESKWISDIRIYRQDRFSVKYANNKEDVFASKGFYAKAARTKIGYLNAASSAVSVIFTGCAYVFVCLKAWAGAFGVGEITQYIGALTMVSGAIGTMITSLNELRNNAEFLKLTFDFLDIPNKMYQGSLTVEKRMDNDYEIEFRDVSFKYPGSENYALRHVSFKFNIGEKLAVVGQNGSGKTTFIKLLCRLYDPDEGEILLNGINIRKYNYLDYISVFSVVFQDFRLFALPLGQNVAINSNYDAGKVNSCLEKAGFILDAEKMPQGLDTYLYKNLDKNGVNVSGGEAQKIAIARALYKNAPFIILDEPTAALDPVAESEIYSRFSEMVTDRTAVYISHRLSSCRFCDKIAVFDHGSVVQVGTHDGLLSDESGKYYELWNAQAQYYDEKE